MSESPFRSERHRKSHARKLAKKTMMSYTVPGRTLLERMEQTLDDQYRKYRQDPTPQRKGATIGVAMAICDYVNFYNQMRNLTPKEVLKSSSERITGEEG